LGAGDFLTLELTAVQLLNGGLQVGGCLVLDETSTIALATNLGVDDVQSRLAGKILQILPAGLDRKVCYPHPVRSATRTWGNTLVGREILVAAGSACKLDNQAFAHEVRAMESRNDVTSIHSILVLDETKAVHELDFSDLAGAMGLEVAFDFRLGGIAGKVAQIEAGR
jgi:hypothetical protein